MQKDFHFFAIAVLARAAGFSNENSLRIATASQYTDDASENKPIHFSNGQIFDPTRTSYIGLKAFDWAIQKKVYIPFHFIPSHPIEKPENSFLVVQNSYFSELILKSAWEEKNTSCLLSRIGIGLHTFADTYAHEGFSGREHPENDVENIWIQFPGKKYKHLLLENFLLDILPQIGHTEAGNFPDEPHIRWKCKKPYFKNTKNEKMEKNNSVLFFTAAKNIYEILRNPCSQNQSDKIPWNEIDQKILKLFQNNANLEQRCVAWKTEFESLFYPLSFDYNPIAFRNEALDPKNEKDTDWDSFHPSRFETLCFEMGQGFYQSTWVNFHRAAMLQRHFVLERLL